MNVEENNFGVLARLGVEISIEQSRWPTTHTLAMATS